jgi:cell division protein FtsI/penicillin-binding protein 2
VKQLGAPYRVGDIVGLSGLQAAYETRLAGTPNAAIVLESGGKVIRTIKRLRGSRTPAGGRDDRSRGAASG